MNRTRRSDGHMPHALAPQGELALARVMQRSPLLGFDFDGTLAPIVTTPALARISQSVGSKLQRLATRLPVAIVSGRRADDVIRRLGFEPYKVIGNHGADLEVQAHDVAEHSLAPVRAALAMRDAELRSVGVTVEDKELSIALHYRVSQRPARAVALIREILQHAAPQCRVFPGKMVENVMPAGLPDKGDAMHQLVRECGASCAIFVGDDANDEPVFASAPGDWLGIRIGRDPDSRADFFLDSHAEIGMLLDRLLAHCPA